MTRLLWIAAILLLSMGGCCPERTTCCGPRPPSRDEVVGTWVANNEFDSVKLELEADGRATLVQWIAMAPNVRIFACDHWQLDNGELYVPLQAVSNADWPLYVRARCSSRCLHAGISMGNNGGGSYQALIRECDLEHRMSALHSVAWDTPRLRSSVSPLLHDFLRRQSLMQEDGDAESDARRRDDDDRRPWRDDAE